MAGDDKSIDYSADEPPPGWKFQSAAGDNIRLGILKSKGGLAILREPVSLDMLIDYFGGVVDGLKNLTTVINNLSVIVDDLEKRPVMIDAGVWEVERTYKAGSFVSHSGSGWVATIESKGARPGEGSCWRLAIKRGRDGKDAGR